MKFFEIVTTACMAVSSWLWPGPPQPPVSFFPEQEHVAHLSREFKLDETSCAYKGEIQRIVGAEKSPSFDACQALNKADAFRNKATIPSSIDLRSFTAHQFAVFFANQGVAEHEILNLACLYALSEFVEFAHHLPGYELAIQHLYQSYGYSNDLYFEGVSLSRVFTSLHTDVEHRKECNRIRTDCASWQDGIIQALEETTSYDAVADATQKSTDFLLKQANRRGKYFLPTELESPLSYAIYTMRHAQSIEEFILNCTLAHHFLCDFHAGIIASPQPPAETIIRSRASDLFVRALRRFVTALNPIHQVSSLCDFFIGTATFVSDMTIGFLYLSPQEHAARRQYYKERACMFHPSNLAQLTAEQWVDIAAKFAANIVCANGFWRAANYLKEVQAIAKANKNAQLLARSMNAAVDAIVIENITVIRAEGIPIDIYGLPTGGKAGNIVKSGIEKLKKFYHPIESRFTAIAEQEAIRLREIYGLARRLSGSMHVIFREMHGKFLKLDFEHIFGPTLVFNPKGVSNIKGFHHDFMKAFEKTGVFKFVQIASTKCGYYLVGIYKNGKKITTKSFFPSHWTRDMVVEKICEAFDEFIRSGRPHKMGKNDKIKIIGITKEGMEIEMLLSKSATISTAYPVAEKIMQGLG